MKHIWLLNYLDGKVHFSAYLTLDAAKAAAEELAGTSDDLCDEDTKWTYLWDEETWHLDAGVGYFINEVPLN